MAEASNPQRPWTPTERPGDNSYASPVVYHGDRQLTNNDEDSEVSEDESAGPRLGFVPDSEAVIQSGNFKPRPLRFKSSQALRDDAAAQAPEVQVYQPYNSQTSTSNTKADIPPTLRPSRSSQNLNIDRGDQLPANNPYRLSQAMRATSDDSVQTLQVQRCSITSASQEHDDTRLPPNNPYRMSQALRSESTEGLLLTKPQRLSQTQSRPPNNPESPAPPASTQSDNKTPTIQTANGLPCITGTSTRQVKILLINPNSTKSMTERCLESIAPTLPTNVTVSGFTPPRPAPSAIESQTDAIMSTAACTRAILPLAPAYDAFLIACFSHHPLIAALREQLAQPVIGIMEASIYSSRMCGSKFGIVTTGIRSSILHDTSARTAYGMDAFCVGTESSRLSVLELETRPEGEVQERLALAARRLQARGAECICLGCAGMTDLQRACRDAVGMHDRVAMVVDGVAMGVHFLVGLVRESLGTAKGGAYNTASGHKSVQPV